MSTTANVFQTLLESLFTPGSELAGILGVTLKIAFISTTVSFLIGVAAGAPIGAGSFRGKKLLLNFTSTFLGFPPVLCGLVVFFLLSRSGPFGQYKLLYSVSAMIFAQILLITPIVLHMTATIISECAPRMLETMQGLRFSRIKQLLLLLWESRGALFSVYFLGFGRAISEVGAAQLVGGNVQFKTRVMTTAIVLETNRGNFAFALAIGILLLAVSFCINLLARLLSRNTL